MGSRRRARNSSGTRCIAETGVMNEKGGGSMSLAVKEQKGGLPFDDVVAAWEDLYSGDWGQWPTTTQRLVLNMHPQFTRRGVTSIFDVGCGRGFLLSSFQDFGYVVAGTEIVPTLLRRDLTAFDEIYPYSVSDLHKIGDGAYDVVLYVDVLDHLQTRSEISDAIRQGWRVASKGMVVAVNCVTPSPLKTVFWDDMKWRDGLFHLSFGGGSFDATSRNGFRVACWKERRDERGGSAEGDGGDAAQDGRTETADGGPAAPGAGPVADRADEEASGED